MVAAGETFLIENHLWVVVSSPAADGSVAMVNFSTHRMPCDETCVIQAGEHSFVRHKTIVRYGNSQIIAAGKHHHLGTNFPAYPLVSKALLVRIQQGALVSQATPSKVAAAIRANP